MKRAVITLAQVFSLIFAMALPAELAAQSRSRNQWEAQVNDQLQVATGALNVGYDIVPSHQTYINALYNNRYQDISYNLQAGVDYLFVGVCDEDCLGMELRLYDGYGHLISSSSMRNGTPILIISALRSETFYLRVTMRDCQDSPCWYGVGAYK